MLPNGSVGQLFAVGVCGALIEGVCGALDSDDVGLAVSVEIRENAGDISLTGADCGMTDGGTTEEVTVQDETATEAVQVITFVVIIPSELLLVYITGTAVTTFDPCVETGTNFGVLGAITAVASGFLSCTGEYI